MKLMFALTSLTLLSLMTNPTIAAGKSFTLPTGETVVDIGCRSKPQKCYKKASKHCGGDPYRVVDSWSNSGGLVADIMDGPFTWYHMYVACGSSDGSAPNFPHRGSRSNGFQAFANAMQQAASNLEASERRLNAGGNSFSSPQGAIQKSAGLCNLAAENTIDRFTKLCVYKCINTTRTKEISGIHSCSRTSMF